MAGTCHMCCEGSASMLHRGFISSACGLLECGTYKGNYTIFHQIFKALHEKKPKALISWLQKKFYFLDLEIKYGWGKCDKEDHKNGWKRLGTYNSNLINQ